MKKIFLILLIFPISIFCQDEKSEIFQEVNGIVLAGPDNDFKITGNLDWTKGVESIKVTYLKGNGIQNSQMSREESTEYYKSLCKDGTRYTEFYDFNKSEMEGEELILCRQKGDFTATGFTLVYKDGFTYTIIANAAPFDYNRVAYLLMYMWNRIHFSE